MTETQLKLKILKKLKDHYRDAWVYKVSDRFRSGIPDIIICYRGRFVAIELKTPKGFATPLQLHTLKEINRYGGTACICRSWQEVDAVMRSFDDKV